MPSRFPGMNPYLERDVVGADFHQTFCTAMRDALVPEGKITFTLGFSSLA